MSHLNEETGFVADIHLSFVCLFSELAELLEVIAELLLLLLEELAH